jgi:hypothetical protein
MDLVMLPEPLQRLVADELDRGEKIVWLGQPEPRPGVSWALLFPSCFAIPWTLFALFWMAAASGVFDVFFGGQGGGRLAGGRVVFALFGLPFVVIGLVMFFSPLWMKRRLRRAAGRTAYVITDRRAIIFDGGYWGDSGLVSLAAGRFARWFKGMQIRSFGPEHLRDLQRIQREDGSGDVLFQAGTTRDAAGNLYPLRVGFLSVPDAKGVEDMLRRLAARPREGEV